MAGKVIGKSLDFGFPGTVSRASDTVIMAYPVSGTENIKFGAPVAFDASTNTVKAVAASTTATDIIGIAIREARQPYVDSEDGWYYKPGDTCNVLVRGTAVVEIGTATGLAARGKVYVDASTLEWTSVATSNKEVTGAIFSTGRKDGNSVVEVTMLERSI